MNFKKVKSMKKILLGVLAVFAISFLGARQSALAIEINEAELAEMRIVSPDPSVNIPGPDGWTPLMHAVQGHDIEAVKTLLKKGASLNILPESVKCEYANVFEYLCDLVVGIGSGDFVDGEYEYTAWRVSEIARVDYYEIVDIILKHCIANGIHLKVNTKVHDDDIYTVWSEYGGYVYFDISGEYPLLFS